MQLEPQDLFENLEFDKVLELLERECLGDLGKEKVQAISPLTQLEPIQQMLLEVSQFKLSIEEKDHFPLSAYYDLSDDLKMLDIEGSVMSIEGLQRINLIMCAFRDIVRFFTPVRQEVYPDLYQIIRQQSIDVSLIAAIEAVIDEKGEIRPDASPELQQIRNRINNRMREMDKQFRRLISEYKQKGWLTDNVESFRNGRRVLSVPAEHKRKIRGIIHDESATGKTAFIEPEAIIQINNDIFDLRRGEQREIYRILKTLSATLRPYTPALANYQKLIIRFDVIRAKGNLAVRMKGFQPKLKPHAFLGIRKAHHPLLLLKNQQLGRPTIPFNLSLLHQNRILVLSGPNAGGKSILMKSVGLLQLMVQSGMLIPVDPESEMGIFKKLFADIGDQQSLDDDLSTYSSRLRNSRIFLENANEHSLILIDEFGSGTDPKIGGAIAEAILDQLNKKQIFGVITTHYSNLKMYAFKARGIVNGAMTFDRDSLSPTYQLKIGRPGSSFAFEIAQKSGLSKKVLKYARSS
ncbi:MAG: DNA mismatch repair protein MutS [Bacteroidota bacterium]